MKRWIMAIALAGYAAGPATAQDLCDARGTFALALHGGAFDQGESLETVSGAPLAFLKDAAADGRKALRDGATAVDAVTQMVRAMEASALFNAGRASIVNEKGFVENDASIMEGAELNAGAVGSLIDT